MVPADEPVEETVRYGDSRIKYTGFLLKDMHGAFDRGRQIGVWGTYDRAGTVVKETGFDD